MSGRFEVYEDRSGKHRFALKDATGRLVAVGEAHETRAEAIDKCRQVQQAVKGAEIVEADR